MSPAKRWVADTAGGLPRPFWHLWLATLVNRAGSFVIIVLAIYLTTVRGFDITYAGLVIGLWGAGGAIGVLLGGVAADRIGRKPTYLTAFYAASGMMLVLGFTTSQAGIAVAVFLLGMVGEAVRPAMSAMMVDIVPNRDRMRAFSLHYWAINLGFTVSAVLAGVLAGIDYQLLFVLDAATTFLAATLVAVKVREPSRQSVPARDIGVRAPGLRTVFADRVFLAFVACNILVAFVFLQHLSTLPLAMIGDGLSTGTYGLVIALNGVLIVAGQLFVPRLIKGRPHAAMLACAALVIGVGFGLTAVADTAWLYAVTVLVWTFGEMINSPSSATTLAELAPAHLRGRYQGVFSLSWSVASFTAPTAGAWVQQHLGDPALWLGCLGLMLAAAAIHLLSGPARVRRAAEVARAEIPTAPKTPTPDPASPVPATA